MRPDAEARLRRATVARPVIREALTRLDRRAREAPAETVLAVFAVAVAAYAVIAPFAAAKYPPMTDLPFHTASTGSLRHYWDPSFHQREQFEWHPLAVPYISMYAIGAVLMLVFPAIVAVKIAAAVMLALVPAGLAVMFHGMKKSPLLGLLGLGLLWCNLTHWGFLNFVGALGLFVMSIGLTLRLVDAPSRGRQIALGVTLVALFFTHIFRYPFALAAVVGTAIVMYPATRRIRPIVAPLVPAVALMIVWLAVRPKALEGDMGRLAIHTERLGEFTGLLTGAFTDPAERLAFDRFFAVAFAVAGASALVALLQRQVGGKRSSLAWSIGVTVIPLACAAVFLGLFLMLPMQMGVWWYVYPREATAAAFLLLGACPDLPKPLFLRAPLAAGIALAGLGVSSVVVTNYRKFDAQTRDFDAIVQHIPKAPKLMYLIFDHGGSTRTSTPFIHLPAYVQADRGGWLSFHFAVWGASSIAYRPREQPGAVVPPPVPLRWEWTPHLFDVRQKGAFFDWFLVRQGRSPDALFAADPSIERVDHVGSWWLYRRKPKG
ncbi:1,4-alpha-glucan (glycogen) branching enzyme, GH-13-type [Minicystis rosea]|nr:1,4-alpha-glucan (glycogen) branching enzyme, GH-13-type [Minicystis rosea]